METKGKSIFLGPSISEMSIPGREFGGGGFRSNSKGNPPLKKEKKNCTYWRQRIHQKGEEIRKKGTTKKTSLHLGMMANRWCYLMMIFVGGIFLELLLLSLSFRSKNPAFFFRASKKSRHQDFIYNALKPNREDGNDANQGGFFPLNCH